MRTFVHEQKFRLPPMASKAESHHDLSTKAGRVCYVMDRAGISVDALSKALGVTPKAIYKWRSGETRNIADEHLFELADRTGFSSRWISMGKGPRHSMRSSDPLADLTPEQRERVQDFINFQRRQA